MGAKRDVQTILKDVDGLMQSVEIGLEQLLGDDPASRVPGLRNVAVFGRSVTLVLQNLRGPAGSKFDEWYEPWAGRMQDDELCRYFRDLRNEMLKTGRTSVGRSARGRVSVRGGEVEELMRNPPPGALGFFIGDALGGSGWDVELPDGTRQALYVSLPESIDASFEMLFDDGGPSVGADEPVSVQAASRYYVGLLREIVADAGRYFDDM